VSADFDPDEFSERVRAAGLRWGRPLHHRAETRSTSDDALQAARSGAASGTLFVADHQSRGRGRSGYSWQSASGDNLLFSLLLRPELNVWPASALPLSVGLAVRAAVAPWSREPLLVKWPNDVLATTRKLAGILCEAQLTPNGTLDALVIGVGVNVHATGFAGELADTATSLALVRPRGGPTPRRDQLLVTLLQTMEHYVGACLERGFDELVREFSLHDALRDRPVVVSGARSLSGVARGVDRDGRLIVETSSGVEWITSGTVRIVEASLSEDRAST
jgi:BirA family biotin operon repressor/biotin-[acetyl-CoA-carboxylase] ligase